jgi:hypothetical protein
VSKRPPPAAVRRRKWFANHDQKWLASAFFRAGLPDHLYQNFRWYEVAGHDPVWCLLDGYTIVFEA